MADLPNHARPPEPTELSESLLSDVQGGLLLPAIQAVREPARSSTPPPTGTVVFTIDG